MKMPLQESGELKEHSEAKVRLLKHYLLNYLSVITNVSTVDQVDIYDLFCGRGLYGDKSEGSPLVVLRSIAEICASLATRFRSAPKINCYFADADPENVKVVAAASEALHNSRFGELRIECCDYADSLKMICSQSTTFRRKEFVFIDPTGYGSIRPGDISKLLARGAEVLLFLPIQFMYRFSANATPEPLSEFINALTGASVLSNTHNVYDFAMKLRDLFRTFVGQGNFVSTFLIEKDASTLFSLYFFTTKWQGHVQMIDAKWKVGEEAGSGWSFRRVPGQRSLLSPETILESYILSALTKGPMHNLQMFEFGVMECEFPSPTVTKACKNLLVSGKIKLNPIAGKNAKAGYFYVGSDKYKDGDLRVEISLV